VAQQVARPAAVVRSGAALVSLPVARLVVQSSIREGGVNQEHVRRLMRLGGRWSPILVHEATGVVIDGLHRVAAARLLGLVRIDATLFSGGPDEALIEFVRRNVHHGLPLTLRERKWACGQVLDVHPHWSDRRIAGICALSPKTVGRLRAVPDDCPSEGLPQLDTTRRMGRDNRLRPVNNVSLRERVAEAIRTQPGASLRSVASSVGVSPETVRSVRMSLGQSSEAERPASTGSVADGVIEGAVEDAGSIADTGTAPPARGLSLVTANSDVTGDLKGWLTRTDVAAAECSNWAKIVPSTCAAAVAAEARRRAEIWLDFAGELDPRPVPVA
jgi:ParB-like chromosome segregation protein Spo0J